jgi:hypothetical protein
MARARILLDDESTLFKGSWDDGRPKSWPTVQLRVRGRAFDIYCTDPTDVTLDGYGIPVVEGLTVSPAELSQGWMTV